VPFFFFAGLWDPAGKLCLPFAGGARSHKARSHNQKGLHGAYVFQGQGEAVLLVEHAEQHDGALLAVEAVEQAASRIAEGKVRLDLGRGGAPQWPVWSALSFLTALILAELLS